MPICSFSVGLDDLPRRKQREDAAVLRVLADAGRFSSFEATANADIARTMDRLQGRAFRITGGTYPWCEIELTDEGRSLLARSS